MKTTHAIGADELREGHTLIGDSISPTRHGAGATVNAVETFGDLVLAIVNGQPVELLARETVYVAA
jgi:hypothetical protein